MRHARHLLGHVHQEPRAAVGTDHRPYCSPHFAAAIGPDDDILREHVEETREISGGARQEEAIGDLPAVLEIGVEALTPHLDALPSPRGQLAARRLGPTQGTSHFPEGVPEDVVEEVGGPLQRSQLLEEDEEGQRERVGLLDR